MKKKSKKKEAKEKKEIKDWRLDFAEELKTIFVELQNESERASVILVAARLDTLLQQLISRFLLPAPTSRDELLNGEAPLSTFSAKIDLCHRLGIIGSDLARALHILRRLRNSFAHEVTGCRIDSGSHRDRVIELITPFKEFEEFSDFVEGLGGMFFSDKSRFTTEFYVVLALLIADLKYAYIGLKPLDGLNAIPLIFDIWKGP